MQRMDKSEILVHISAPSGVVDDACYRAQVEAILNFQSHSRELITLRADETPSHLASSLLHSSASPHLDTNNGPVSVIPDSQPQQPEFIAESLHLTPFLLSKRPRLGSPPRSLRGEIQRPETAATASTATASHNTTTQDEHEDDESKQSTLPPEKLEQKQWLDLSSLPLEIKPPPPPIASSPFITHITPTLEMLTKRLKSPRSYNPTNQTRDLDNLERGYWCLRINITSNGPEKPTAPNPISWDTTFFLNFWTFLSDFIAKEGRAGWGVWCIAEDETPSSRTPVPQETPEGEASQLLGTPRTTQQLAVKVYAWGEIACHIYLLLFLASERRIRKMGAQWRDARDIVVIQMP
ncbi:hypothetical protein BJX68DRAFT_268522 [Aspergillus pseudodeflectus]|uniref:Uncharacterized protein n=1 Tax=Aspergillus pseudodeflectus TaxID=176178 RepID=A0ABR4K6G7_9EURO